MSITKGILIPQWSDGIGLIKFNRPEKKNALTLNNYSEIAEGIH